jgi:hypothetical protein
MEATKTENVCGRDDASYSGAGRVKGPDAFLIPKGASREGRWASDANHCRDRRASTTDTIDSEIQLGTHTLMRGMSCKPWRRACAENIERT